MQLGVILILLFVQQVFGGSTWRPPASVQTPLQKAQALVANMTQDEKINLVHGYPIRYANGYYAGNIPSNSRLRIPSLQLQDGPQGVAEGLTRVTTWPAAITVAATWDTSLMYAWGTAMGQEQRGKGANVLLGPDINIARVPMGGRIFEMFSEDPVLTAKLTIASITGIQSQGVIATAKHYIDNEQEYQRNYVSIQVDERTQWEIYYYPFIAAIQAGVGAIMCSYNRINGTYACENSKALADLKTKMGFQGWVMSDWGATHSTEPSALAGLDMEMPYGTYFGQSLSAAVNAGQVPKSRLDDMVTRILTSMYSVGVMTNFNSTGDLSANVSSAEHNQLAYTLAVNSLTLLKNDGILPLTASGQTFAVIGDPPKPVGGGSGAVTTLYYISPFDGITKRVGAAGRVVYTGSNPTTAANVARNATYAIVCVGFTSGEGSDRSSLSNPSFDNLIAAVAAANPNTIVVLYGPGPALMPWADSVRAILFGYFAGQELGNALANILFGDANPSGKLPVTFPVNQNDWFSGSTSQYPGYDTMVYSEKLLVGYRWYDNQNITPLFPFGHGLSYTTFTYSNLSISGNMTSGLIVALKVANSGRFAGSEVVQLYVNYPSYAGEPPKVLRAFDKITLAANTSTQVRFVLQLSDISIWDVAASGFLPVSGVFGILVGSSSRDIRLTGNFTYQK